MNTVRLPLLASVSALPDGRRIRLAWTDGRCDELDLGDFLADFESFRPLDDDLLFRQVGVAEEGREISWGGDMAIAAGTLRRLVAEQSPEATEAEIFNAWMARNGLSAAGAAEALGVTRRTVIYYRTGQKPLPKVVQLACLGWETRQKQAA